MKICAGFSRVDKIGSKLISWWIGAPYSHVFLEIDDCETGIKMIVEAGHGSVRMLSKENWLKNNIIVDCVYFDIEAIILKSLKQNIINKLGILYGYSTLVGIFFKNRIGIDGDKQYICSELVTQLLIESNIIPATNFGKNIDQVTPKDLYCYLISLKTTL